MTFERMLQRWLERMGYSPEQAAPHLGVGHVAIYAWLAGEYQPSATRVVLLARALDVTDDALRKAIARSRQELV